MEDPIDETIEAFELLQVQGKIRYYGISSIRPNVIREYVDRSAIVSVMMQYSLLDRRPEEECFPLLLKNNIGVLARGAIAKGLLTGKSATDFLNYKKEEVRKVADAIQSVSVGKQLSPHTAIQFVLRQPAVTSAIVGIRTIQQLEDAAGVMDRVALTESDYSFLSELLPVNFYDSYR